jgi:hypothetical protein
MLQASSARRQFAGRFFKQWKTARVSMARLLMIGSTALILSACNDKTCSDVGGCGDIGGGNGGNPSPTPTPTVGSSATASGSVDLYSKDGTTYVLTPGAAGDGTVNLLTLPNTSGAVINTPVTTSLNAISGISVDPVNDVGMAFDYNEGKISLFNKLSTTTTPAQEVGTYDTLTTCSLSFSSGASICIAGAIMNPANKTMILATGDGFEILDYTDPAAPVKIREIPSLQADPNGVEIMENFAFDPALPIGNLNYAMIITGGGQNGPGHVMELVDADTGQVYHPDASTVALLPLTDYIDAAAVDTNFHVVVLAEEEASSTYLINLKAATLDASAGTYSLPAKAVKHINQYFKYTNLAIESTNHLVMMGKGCGGTDTVIGLLEDPLTALRFVYDAQVTMPTDTDDVGNTVTWNGWCDPHGAVAYIAQTTSSPKTSMGLWLNASADHLAVINLQNVLDGTRLLGGSYDPTATTPKDIAYLAIP